MSLKKKLKEALKKAGLSEELAEGINLTDESQIEGVVIGLQATQQSDAEPDFHSILGSQEFADYVSENGFDKVIKLSKPLQSAHDKKVTEGIKTFQEKYFKKINGDEQDPEPNDDEKVPAWAKSLIEKVDSFEKSKTTQSKTEQASKALSSSEIIPEKFKKRWLSRLNLDSETSFEDQVKELETEYKELHTDLVGSSAGSGLPNGGSNTGEATDEEVDAILG